MATTFPPNVLDLSFRCNIEGRHYDRPTKYEQVTASQELREALQLLSRKVYRGEAGWGNVDEIPAELLNAPGTEWVVVQRNYQSYPSGGESHYPSYAYWNGRHLEVAQRNGDINWRTVDFYIVKRAAFEQDPLSEEQKQVALSTIADTLSLFERGNRIPWYTERLQEEQKAMLEGTATLSLWWEWYWYDITFRKPFDRTTVAL